MTHLTRDEIVQRFETWLDEIYGNETSLEKPAGADEKFLTALTGEGFKKRQGHDLYDMWSAITTLAQEVKLQGRTFKALSDNLEPSANMHETLPELMALNQETCTRTQQIFQFQHQLLNEQLQRNKREAAGEVRKEMIQVLIQIRNRMCIGLKTVSESLKQLEGYSLSRWRYRLFKHKAEATRRMIEIVSSLCTGYRMTLDQIDEQLHRMGVREIDCMNQAFDPRTMFVADLKRTEEVPEGTVLEVYQPGYLWHDEVLYPAHVKVSTASEQKGVTPA